MTTGYLVGTGENINDGVMTKVQVEQGSVGVNVMRKSITPAIALHDTTTASGDIGAFEGAVQQRIDIRLGQSNKPANPSWAVNDTVGSLPSGYSVNGDPTYGDGQVARSGCSVM
jgi:hypothetical protein